MLARQPDRFLVFVSHSSQDEPLAMRLATILDSLFLPTFVYGKYRVGGQNRFEVIRHRLLQCPYFLLLLTRRARRSEWVNQEVGFAVASGKQIIPVVETTSMRGRRIRFIGFTELNDPLDLAIDDAQPGIGELLRTLMQYAKSDGLWRDQVRVSCKCGWSGRRPVGSLTRWYWVCQNCGGDIRVSPVTYEPLPQED